MFIIGYLHLDWLSSHITIWVTPIHYSLLWCLHFNFICICICRFLSLVTDLLDGSPTRPYFFPNDIVLRCCRCFEATSYSIRNLLHQDPKQSGLPCPSVGDHLKVQSTRSLEPLLDRSGNMRLCNGMAENMRLPNINFQMLMGKHGRRVSKEKISSKFYHNAQL